MYKPRYYFCYKSLCKILLSEHRRRIQPLRLEQLDYPSTKDNSCH